MKSKLASIWRTHRKFNPQEVVEECIYDYLIDRYGYDPVCRHVVAIRSALRGLEKNYRRVHKFDEIYTAKLMAGRAA